MRIIFVRHGEPDYKNDCLTAEGHIQAEAVAKRLANEKIEGIYSSPMGRARMTMQKFADQHPDLPVKILDFMHEINWGSTSGKEIPLEGHPWNCVNEMVSRGINVCDSDWKNGSYFNGNIATENVESIAKEIDGWLLSLGYSREGFYYRNLLKDDEQHTVVLFCHGGSSCAAIAHMTNLPFTFTCAAIHMPFTAVTILRLDKNPDSLCTPVLEQLSDIRHLS